MKNDVYALIRANYNQLSDSQKVVADYVTENPNVVMMSTLSEMASKLMLSETTILRFLRKIGYQSFQVFKINLTQFVSRDSPKVVYEDVSFEDTTEHIMSKLVNSTVNSIKDSLLVIKPEAIDFFINSMIHANKVVVIGMGASASVATDLYHKLLKLGINCVVSNDPHLINILSSNLTSKDFLIVFSHTGESREVLDSVALAKENRCTVGAITSYPKSTLAMRSDAAIISSSLETKFRSDALTSRIIQMVVVDFLYVTMTIKFRDTTIDKIHKSQIAVAKNKT